MRIAKRLEEFDAYLGTGMMLGNKGIIAGMAKIKSHSDRGMDDPRFHVWHIRRRIFPHCPDPSGRAAG